MIKKIVRSLYDWRTYKKYNYVGKGTKINPTASIDKKELMTIGDHSFIGKWCHISIE